MTSKAGAPARELEKKTCGRCGGSGKFSWCAMYGDTCFGCAGRGWTYTKRGAAAALYLEELRSLPAPELKPGLVVVVDGITLGGSPYREWATVIAAGPDELNPGRWRLETAAVKNPARTCNHGVFPETRFRVRQTAEEAARTLEAALAYQDSLTVKGEPRKVRGRKEAAC